MTDLEFDVLDELYFVVEFNQLEKELQLEKSVLIDVLEMLYKKDWIKCFVNHNKEEEPGKANIRNNPHKYLYLASKKGLLAHNAD